MSSVQSTSCCLGGVSSEEECASVRVFQTLNYSLHSLASASLSIVEAPVLRHTSVFLCAACFTRSSIAIHMHTHKVSV